MINRKFFDRACEIHDRWCRANTDHSTEIAMLERGLLTAYYEGVNVGRDSVVAKSGGVTIIGKAANP